MSLIQYSIVSDEINQKYNILLGEAKKILSMSEKTNLVAVFDIDNTLIDGYGRPILQMKDLYEYILSLGMPIILITARPPEIIEPTIKSLKNAGYFMKSETTFGYSEILMCDDAWTSEALGIEKTIFRKSIYDSGKKIILNIGDSSNDHLPLDGIYYFEKSIKLPELTYFGELIV